MVRQIFNEILKRNSFTPDEWKKVKIKVIHKKGDVENVSNYRPICSLPAVVQTVLGNSVRRLDSEKPTRRRTTLQHRNAMSGESKCGQRRSDFTKVFDSISHKSFWEALKSCNVDHEYVSLLRKIYRDQKASVQTDEESNIFDIQKGSKQGDPMSSLAIQHSAAIPFEGRNTKMEKEKRNGDILERP